MTCLSRPQSAMEHTYELNVFLVCVVMSVKVTLRGSGRNAILEVT